MTEWVDACPEAQLLGLIAHEYGYTPEEIGRLTMFQIAFLISWLEWFRRRRT